MAVRAGLLFVGAGCVSAHMRGTGTAKMQPDQVAHTLVQVEDEWRGQAASFAECNVTATDAAQDCASAPKAFDASCSTVVNAVVQSSNGDRHTVKEYMADICGESTLQGWRQERCSTLALAIDNAMTEDNYDNREGLNVNMLCQKFWSHFAQEETERVAKEKAAEEKAAAEQAAADKKAAEEAAAEAKQKSIEEADKKAKEAQEKATEAAERLVAKQAEAAKMQEEAQKKSEESATLAAEVKKHQENANRTAAEAQKVRNSMNTSAPVAANKTEPVAVKFEKINVTVVAAVAVPKAENVTNKTVVAAVKAENKTATNATK